MKVFVLTMAVLASVVSPVAAPTTAKAAYCIQNCNPAGCNVFCI